MVKYKIERHKREFNPITGKYKWEIKYVDGTVEHKELPEFIDLCPACGQNWVNKIKENHCPSKMKAGCCATCGKECEKLGTCQLK